jgi:CoA:oxalate CoA-transferase
VSGTREQTKVRALEGIRVLEVAGFAAGPLAGRLFAINGAEVVKLEAPGLGDPARRRGPFLHDRPGPDRSALFLYLNAGKLGVTLDLTRSSGRDLFRRLAALVDVAIVDVAPALLPELGLTWERLAGANPGIVLVCLSPFGLSGPNRDWRAWDLNVFHAGGEGYLLPNGLAWEQCPDGPPLRPGGWLAEYLAGVAAATGALAALWARTRSGRGQLVDCSKQETQLVLNHVAVQRYLDGVLETRATRSFAYGGVIPCRDGYVELLTIEPHQWAALVRFMGSPVWACDPRFADPVSRGQHGAEINRHLREWARERTREWLYKEGQAAGVPVVPYRTPEEILKSPQETERGFFLELNHPETGPLTYPSWPFRFSETPPALHRPAPLLGEHNEAVYGQWLGLGREALAELAQAGIV